MGLGSGMAPLKGRPRFTGTDRVRQREEAVAGRAVGTLQASGPELGSGLHQLWDLGHVAGAPLSLSLFNRESGPRPLPQRGWLTY